MSKKSIIRVSIFITLAVVVIFLLINHRPFLRMFKKTKHLNYSDISYISVKLGIDANNIDIYDTDDIEKIIDYLNSLELIEEMIPRKEKAFYDGDDEVYDNKLRETGWFIISISGNLISFSTEYLTVLYEDGFTQRSYYIVDSGYNPETQTSKFYDFLEELVSKYVEE